MFVSHSRGERKAQILNVLAIGVGDCTKTKLSMRQIARRIGMTPSAHVMSILWDLVDEGRVIASPRNYRDMVAWDFSLPARRPTIYNTLEKVS